MKFNLDFTKPEDNIQNYNNHLGDTCSGKKYGHVIEGIYIQFKDTFFFSYIIQYVLVVLMYIKVGSGRYWKVLHYASLAGLIAAIGENVTVAFICENYDNGNYSPDSFYKKKIYTFLVDEIFWIITEFSIPYLNLIKMKAFAEGRIAKLINIVIYILFIPFSASRICIGIARMMKGYLNYSDIELFHGIAFGIMAIADLICTIFILHFIKKYNNRSSTHGNDLTNHIQQSSYTILITVDVVSIVLSVLYIVTTNIDFGTPILSNNSVLPFHCFKSVFLLILATDALLFKYGAGSNSTLKDSNENKTSNYNDTMYQSSQKGIRMSSYKPIDSPSNMNSMNSSSLRSPKVMSMSYFGYNPNNDIYSYSKGSENPYSKSMENLSRPSNDIDIKPFPSEHFGLIHHGEYNENIFKNRKF